MKTSTCIIISVIIIAMAAVAFGYTKQHRQQVSIEKPVIKIGVTLPLTGDIAMLGQSNKKAIELAESTLGNTKYRYEVVIEDDQFKPSIGATTANKLISIDRVSALISFGSPVGNTVSPIAEKAQIPHINDFASDPHVADGAYNFIHYTPAYKDSERMVQELRKRNIRKVVFFRQQDNPGGDALLHAFENSIIGTNVQILASEGFTTGTRDFRTVINKTRNLGAEIYILILSTPELEIITKQLREAGIVTPVTCMETFEFSDQLSLFEGMWYVNAADPMQKFIDLYTSMYSEGPKLGAANGYDSFNLLVHAVEEAGNGKTIPTGPEIQNALAHVKGFDGALGDGLSIDTEGLVMSKAVLRMIKDGKPVTISQ